MEQPRKQPPDDFPYLGGVEDKCEKAIEGESWHVCQAL